MPYTILKKNDHTVKFKNGPSLTIAIFGPWPFLFRGVWTWFFIVLFASWLAGGLFVALTRDPAVGSIGVLLVHVVIAVFGNRISVKWLSARGWTVLKE